MNSVREYHNDAIRYAQLAMIALHKGEKNEHQRLVQRAMILETQAADLVPDEKSSEPTRSILYRSAASFAYQAGDYQEAERLVFKGLAGYPSPQVKQQLLEIQQMIHEARRHQPLADDDISILAQPFVTAIYENGALHPTVTLPLQERQKVEIQIFPVLEGVPR